MFTNGALFGGCPPPLGGASFPESPFQNAGPTSPWSPDSERSNTLKHQGVAPFKPFSETISWHPLGP